MTTFNAGAIEASLALGRTSWTRDLKKTKAEIAQLAKTSIDIVVDLADASARASMESLQASLAEFDASEYTPDVDVATAAASAALDVLDQRLDALDRRAVQVMVYAETINAEIALSNLEGNYLNVLDKDGVTIDVDTKIDTADLDALEARLNDFETNTYEARLSLDAESVADDLAVLSLQLEAANTNLDIGVNVDDEVAKGQLIELATFINAIGLAKLNIDVEVDGYSTAIAQLATLEAQAFAVGNVDPSIDVDVDRDLLSDLVGDSGSGGGGGGYFGLLKIILYAILLLSPLLAAATGALTATIIALGAAVAGAAGSVAVLAGGLVGLVQRFKDTDPSDYTPQMQAFADAIDAVKDAYNGFLDQIEDAGFTLMADALQLVADILPTLAPLFNETAEMFGGVLDGIRNFVESPEYDEMLDFFGGFGVDMLESFLQIGGNLLRFFGRLFQAIEPFARDLMSGLEDVTEGWMEWADDLENNESFQLFVENAMEYGPMVLDLLGSIIQAFINIGRALEPLAGPLIQGLIWFFDFIANMDPQVLTWLIVALAGLWFGFSILLPIISTIVGVVGGLVGVFGAALGPILLVIGVIAALVGIFIYLWETNDKFRDGVTDAWNAIWTTIEPIVTDLVNLIRDNWGPISKWAKDLWNDISSAVRDAMAIISMLTEVVLTNITFIWKHFGDDIMQVLTGAFQVIGALVRGFFGMLRETFSLIRNVMTGNWSGAWENIKNMARIGAQTLVGVIRGLGNILGGIFSAIGKFMISTWSSAIAAINRAAGNAADFVKEQFQRMMDFIMGIPGRIRAMASGMWDSMVDSLKDTINALIRLWNNLSFSVDIPDKIPGLPDSYEINTPNVSELAKGAYVDDEMLALIGEGADSEIVAPEPVLKQIVRDYSGADIDYGRMADAIVAALGYRITKDDLQNLMDSAGDINMPIDARSDADSATRLAAAIMYQIRRMKFGGRLANV